MCFLLYHSVILPQNWNASVKNIEIFLIVVVKVDRSLKTAQQTKIK